MTVTEPADKTNITLVVTQQVFPVSKFLNRDTELMFSDKNNPSVNSSWNVATYTQISHSDTGGRPHRRMLPKP